MRTKYLLAAAAAMLGASIVSAAPEGRLAKLDTDNSGGISLAEMNAHSAERFARLDADRDGFVTKAEMSAHREMMRAERGGKAREQAGRHQGQSRRHGEGFARRDTDGDGRLSLAEFQATTAKHFARLDANGDGVVAREEFAKLREARQAKRQG